MNQHNFSISKNELAQIVKPTQLFDPQTVNDIVTQVFASNANFSPNIVIDLSAVPVMNSLGLNLLIQIQNKSKELNGKTIVINASKKIEELIALTKLNTILTVVPDIDQALDLIRN